MLRFRLPAAVSVAAVALGLIFGIPLLAMAAGPQPSARAMARVMEVQDRNTERFLAMQGVVGTATGVDLTGQAVVKVFLAKKGTRGIPKNVEGVPVVTQVTGEIFALGDTLSKQRPAPIGVSCGHPAITAGTIGCRLTDGGTGVYILSNNHVFADENYGQIGDSILQPGPFDGGLDQFDAIGVLVDFEPIKFRGRNFIDAAIAIPFQDEVTGYLVGIETPSDGYGMPKSTTVSPEVGQAVQKYGRTTEQTHGTIDAINATVRVGYSSGTARFVDQIIVTPGTFSAGGDSGSLVVIESSDDSDRCPVGLLFAGSSSITICNPIDAVLERFGLMIDGEGTVTVPNRPPVADFLYATSDLVASFTDSSSEPDGDDITWAWDFGDTATASTQDPVHPYGSAGDYNVTLTVTDEFGASDTFSQSVTVSTSTGSGDFTLGAFDYKAKKRQLVELTWVGGASTVTIYRNGQAIRTDLPGTGSFTDNLGTKASGTYTYYVTDGLDRDSNEILFQF